MNINWNRFLSVELSCDSFVWVIWCYFKVTLSVISYLYHSLVQTRQWNSSGNHRTRAQVRNTRPTKGMETKMFGHYGVRYFKKVKYSTRTNKRNSILRINRLSEDPFKETFCEIKLKCTYLLLLLVFTFGCICILMNLTVNIIWNIPVALFHIVGIIFQIIE